MRREYHRWYSPSLNHDMELLTFGHSGLPVVVFPVSNGRFYEWENRDLLPAVAPSIEEGRIRLYCVDSVDRESWYNYGAHPRHRVERHLAYEAYILREVIPLTHTHAPDRWDKRVGVTGASLGAFHAALLAFRHPSAVSVLLALSGKYENSRFLRGYSDDLTYLTNPLAFLPNLHDHGTLEAMRNMSINIVSGETDPHIHEARELSATLWGKAVPNNLDVWGGWAHDWPYWQDMLRKYL